MQEFSDTLNRTIKAGIAYTLILRAHQFYISLIFMLLLVIGMFIGVSQTTHQNIYGVTIMYLVSINQLFQWVLRQIIATEGIMLSTERIG